MWVHLCARAARRGSRFVGRRAREREYIVRRYKRAVFVGMQDVLYSFEKMERVWVLLLSLLRDILSCVL